MTLAIIWRVNPVEVSVVPAFSSGSPVGRAVLWMLIVTCTPAWILAGFMIMLTPAPDRMPYVLVAGLMLTLQAVVYLLLGTLVSIGRRRLTGKNRAALPSPRPQ